MPKPYSIQAPEEVAKAYGGDKQKIAQAAQMGIVDPTAAVLAGMFIDKMRSAQSQEALNPPTVAQQVLGGQQAAPQMPPPGPPAGGLGAMPQAGVPVQGAPDMSAMAPPQEEAPMGMAEGGMVPPYAAGGGLSDLPVPETMFDEPRNGGFDDGYAGGGLVAFAGGGMSDLYDDVEYWESRGRQSAVSPKGARGVMQLMPGTQRDPGFGVAPAKDASEAENRRVGRAYLDAMHSRYADPTTALMAYNWGPGNVDKWIAAGRPASMVPSETRKYVANITGGKAPAGGTPTASQPPTASFAPTTAPESEEDVFSRLQTRFGPSKEDQEAEAAKRARLKEEGSDEYYEKQRKQDMWQTLAEIGFNMASSKSPYLLQAVGEAAAAALPGAREDKKERKALKNRALDALVAMGADNRKEALQTYGVAVDVAKQKHAQRMAEAQQALGERQLTQQGELTREEIKSREEIARAGNVAQLQAAEISAGKGLLDPYDSKIENLKLPDGTEVSTPIRTNKQTGGTEYYSTAAKSWLAPEYATALMTAPNAMAALKTWGQTNNLDVGIVDGKIMWHNSGNGTTGLVRPEWLAKAQ